MSNAETSVETYPPTQCICRHYLNGVIERVEGCPFHSKVNVAIKDAVDWKMRHDTEQTMHAAWRKRAEEAELRENRYLKVLRSLAGGMNTSCAWCETIFGYEHTEECQIALLLNLVAIDQSLRKHRNGVQ